MADVLFRRLDFFQSNRISVVFALVAIALLSSASCAKETKESKAQKTLNVKDFGAKGDGATDDYDALQAAALAVCQSPGATLHFPEGVYRIDRYRIVAGPKQNNVQNIRYTGCQGNTIMGVRAKIDVKGDFRRRADQKHGGNSVSYAASVIPFEMVNSSRFRIIGFELEGNVDQMSRDPNVVEGSASGILTTNCQDYFIEDVIVHGFAADGITLGGNSQSADQRVHLVNVTSTHNARHGLAIIRVRGAEVMNAVFNDNGRTGAYGNHAPAAGAAVEPARFPPQEDVATGDITFDKCRFEENLGPQFLSGRPDLVDSLTIKNSSIKSTLPDTDATGFMSVPKVGLVQGNTFDIAARHGVALAVYSPELYRSINRLTYRQNTFKLGDNKGIIGPVQPAPVELIGNTIRVESRKADPSLLRLDYLKLVEDNCIFEANSGYSGVHYTVLYENGTATVRGNKYDTDRSAPGYFDVYYGPDVLTAHEMFPHPANFQPHYSKPTAKGQ